MAVLTIRGSNDLHEPTDKFPHHAIVCVQAWTVTTTSSASRSITLDLQGRFDIKSLVALRPCATKRSRLVRGSIFTTWFIAASRRARCSLFFYGADALRQGGQAAIKQSPSSNHPPPLATYPGVQTLTVEQDSNRQIATLTISNSMCHHFRYKLFFLLTHLLCFS